jgi:signal transduction histidine kinase
MQVQGASRWTPASAWRSLSPKTQFLATAVLVVCCLMVVLGQWMSARITSSYVHARADAGALYMEGFLAAHVQELSDGRAALSDGKADLLDDLLDNTGLAHRVEGIKIWLRDGTIAYSTDKSLIGKRLPSSEVDAGFQGKVTSKIEQSPDKEHAGQMIKNYPLLEVYAPIYKEDSSQVIAVGEFYEKAGSMIAALSRSTRATWVIVGAMTAMMAGLLYLIVRSANDLIVRQRHLLHRQLDASQALSDQNDKLRQAAELARMEASKSNESVLNRIGADIHDGPVQVLSALLLRPRDARSVQRLAKHVLDELREISSGLVLPEIETVPLESALRLAVQRHRSATGTAVAERYANLSMPVAHPLKICLYRVVQEALNNAFRHGAGMGQKVEAAIDDRQIITVSVSDSGPGFAARSATDQTRKPLGLDGIRNRVDAFGGTLEIISADDNGAMLMVKIPLAGNGA